MLQNNSLGFSTARIGGHSARSMMFLEMRALVRTMPLTVTKKDFTTAIIEENILEKPTLISRKKSLHHLMEIYGMDPSKYNLVREGDLFIYRKPGTSSETKEFYFFGACKIGRIERNPRCSATFSKICRVKNNIHKSDLDNFDWTWKQRGGSWKNFFQQYGMNKIPRTDYIALLKMFQNNGIISYGKGA